MNKDTNKSVESVLLYPLQCRSGLPMNSEYSSSRDLLEGPEVFASKAFKQTRQVKGAVNYMKVSLIWVTILAESELLQHRSIACHTIRLSVYNSAYQREDIASVCHCSIVPEMLLKGGTKRNLSVIFP